MSTMETSSTQDETSTPTPSPPQTTEMKETNNNNSPPPAATGMDVIMEKPLPANHSGHACLARAHHDQKALFGRDAEKQQLKAMYLNLIAEDAPLQACWVHGESGSGKTALCRQYQRAPDLYFLEGKFDQYEFPSSPTSNDNDNDDDPVGVGMAMPYSALIHAFDSLRRQVMRKHLNDADAGGDLDVLQQALTEEAQLLNDLIPSFEKLTRAYRAAQAKAAQESEAASTNTETPEAEEEKTNQEDHEDDNDGNQNKNLDLVGKRLAVAFASLLRRFASPQRPVVLFLDDLQWADPGTIEVLTVLLSDEQTCLHNVLFLGGYRDVHAETDTQMTPESVTTLQSQLNNSHVDFQDLHVTNLSLEAVQEMIHSLLSNLEDDQATKLAQMVFDKTSGNPFFVLQYLTALQRRKMLQYAKAASHGETPNETCASGEKWQCNWNMLMSSQGNNVHASQYVMERIDGMPQAVKQLLQLASFLGFQIDRALLETVYHHAAEILQYDVHDRQTEYQIKLPGGDEEESKKTEPELIEKHAPEHHDFDQVVSWAVEDHLLEETASSSSFRSSTSASLKFSHDRIRQLSYESLGIDDSDKKNQQEQGEQPSYKKKNYTLEQLSKMQKSRLHYSLGKFLCDYYGVSHSSPYILLAAYQMNRGSDCVSGMCELGPNRLRLVQLNLEASKVARKRGADQLVCQFLTKAVELIHTDHRDWENGSIYQMVLEVHTRLAEVELSRGHFDQANQLVGTILKHAQTARDKIPALKVRSRSYSSQLQFGKAIEVLREALDVLGVNFRNSNRVSQVSEVLRIKRLVRGYTDDDFLSLEPMTDETMLLAVQILTDIGLYGFINDRTTNILAFCKLIQTTLEYGMCAETGLAYAGYAQILGVMGNMAEAHRFSQLALQVSHMNNGHHYQGRNYASNGDTGNTSAATIHFIHGMCAHIKAPLASSLDPALKGYRSSLEQGDVFYGILCLCSYCHIYLMCGLPLGPFFADAKNFAGQLKLFGHDSALGMILPNIVMAKNLTGQSEDPKEMTWKAIEALGFVSDPTVADIFAENSTSPKRLMMLYYQVWLAYIMDDLDLAEETMNKILAMPKNDRRFLGSHFANYLCEYLDGAVGYRLYAKTHRRVFRNIADRALQWMKNSQSINCVAFAQFLEAQKASVMDRANKDGVKGLYDKAITSFVRSGYSNFAAIANEEAAQYMLYHKDNFWAEEYLQRAITLYGEWGATVKVDHMRSKYEYFQNDVEQDRNALARHGTALRGRERFQSVVKTLSRNEVGGEADLALGLDEAS